MATERAYKSVCSSSFTWMVANNVQTIQHLPFTVFCYYLILFSSFLTTHRAGTFSYFWLVLYNKNKSLQFKIQITTTPSAPAMGNSHSSHMFLHGGIPNWRRRAWERKPRRKDEDSPQQLPRGHRQAPEDHRQRHTAVDGRPQLPQGQPQAPRAPAHPWLPGPVFGQGRPNPRPPAIRTPGRGHGDGEHEHQHPNPQLRLMSGALPPPPPGTTFKPPTPPYPGPSCVTDIDEADPSHHVHLSPSTPSEDGSRSNFPGSCCVSGPGDDIYIRTQLTKTAAGAPRRAAVPDNLLANDEDPLPRTRRGRRPSAASSDAFTPVFHAKCNTGNHPRVSPAPPNRSQHGNNDRASVHAPIVEDAGRARTGEMVQSGGASLVPLREILGPRAMSGRAFEGCGVKV